MRTHEHTFRLGRWVFTMARTDERLTRAQKREDRELWRRLDAVNARHARGDDPEVVAIGRALTERRLAGRPPLRRYYLTDSPPDTPAGTEP